LISSGEKGVAREVREEKEVQEVAEEVQEGNVSRLRNLMIIPNIFLKYIDKSTYCLLLLC
jgi:hypothetical protein